MLVRYSVERPPLKTKLLSNVFPLRHWSYGFGRVGEMTGVKCQFHDTISKVRAVNSTWRMLFSFDYLVEVVSNCQVLPL